MLVVRHVEWEGPHRIVEALGDLSPIEVDPVAGASLPAPAEVAGAVFMGGPMSANDTAGYPALAAEIEWLAEAVALEVPVLGVCLGSQLLARALGSGVRPGPAPEIGWAPIEVLDASDPVIGPLAPATAVLHWHGDVFDLPDGATALARSRATTVQAFRAGATAWGLLFHAEADGRLVERWLTEPSMSAEAAQALGRDHDRRLREGAAAAEPDLIERSARGFAAFAVRCGDRAGTP